MRRRDALVIGGAIAMALAIPPILRRVPSDFDFSPIPGFPGFRRTGGGTTSGGNIALIGLDQRLPDQDGAPVKLPENPCLALFGPQGWSQGEVPIAVFSDFSCPYCRVLDDRLIALRDSGASVRLIWRELPLLGDSSYRAAKAAIAARFADKEDRARQYLWQHSMPPGKVGLNRLADALEIDRGWLQREVSTRRVQEQLLKDMTLGLALGIPGTPGTVVGRTLVIGAIREADLDRLIKIELAEGPLDCS